MYFDLHRGVHWGHAHAHVLCECAHVFVNCMLCARVHVLCECGHVFVCCVNVLTCLCVV